MIIGKASRTESYSTWTGRACCSGLQTSSGLLSVALSGLSCCAVACAELWGGACTVCCVAVKSGSARAVTRTVHRYITPTQQDHGGK
eukprot:scaffold1170_cov158-Ochromonas_danica.AAC.7